MKQLVMNAAFVMVLATTGLCAMEKEEIQVALKPPKFQEHLICAIQDGLVDEIIAAIDHGADVNFSDENLNYRRPLQVALNLLHPKEHFLDAIDTLLKHGAQPTTDDLICALKLMPTGSGNCTLVKRLIEAGAQVDSSDYYNPLFYAIEQESPELVRLIVSHEFSSKYKKGKLLNTRKNLAYTSLNDLKEKVEKLQEMVTAQEINRNYHGLLNLKERVARLRSIITILEAAQELDQRSVVVDEEVMFIQE